MTCNRLHVKLDPMRIGIVGTENSHVDHIIEYLNVERRDGQTRVVALTGGANERNEKLRAAGGIERLVDEPAELLGLVDAVIVADRQGAAHRAQAVPFLAANLPVYIDKPLACSESDARAIVAAARENNAPLTSYSAVRWVPDTDRLAEEAASLGATQVVTASGPGDPASPYGGIFFYGIHAIDVALRLAPGEIGEVRVERTAETVVATVPVGPAQVVINLVLPGPDGQVPFHAMVIGRHGISARELTLGAGYGEPALRAFLEMTRTGVPPIPYDDLIRPIAVLDAIAAALKV